MTKAANIRDGLNYLLSHFDKKVEVCSTHDAFYAGAPGDDAPDIVKYMESIGWRRSEDSWCIFT